MRTRLASILCALSLTFLGCGGGDFDPDASNADGPMIDGAIPDARVPDAEEPDAEEPDGAPPPGPNCQGLPATCGPGGDHSCCANSVVTGGTYYRSYDAASDDYNDQSYPATVSDFRLDTYEVTVGRFRAFVEAGKGTQLDPPVAGSGAHSAIAGSGWSVSWDSELVADTAALKAAVNCYAGFQTWTDDPGLNEEKAMNCMSWYEAMAFCIWDGGYLPTEAEWNYAATGGSDQRAYPWSSPPESTTIDATYAVYLGSGAVAEVGSKSPKGDGRWGQSDLAGNVHEWTLDWHATTHTNPCNDCANLTDGVCRVVRGGAYYGSVESLRAASRSCVSPDNHSYTGFRCARTP